MQFLFFCVLTFSAILAHSPAVAAEGNAIGSFRAALQAAHEDPGTPLSMQVQCTDDKGIRSMTLYPSGVVIWNRKRQARIGSGDRVALLHLLLNADFPSFKDRYGGKPEAEKTGAPIMVLCSIDVRAGGVAKSSYQDLNGARSEIFMSLAGSLLDRVEPLAAKGVGATSLADGLAKLASGDLAPEAFTLRLLHMPADDSSLGVILEVASGQSSRRDYRPGVKVGEPQSAALTKADFKVLLAAIHSADLLDLPHNLPATDIYQLNLRVLQHEYSVRARPTNQIPSTELDQALARLERFADRLIGSKGDKP